MSPPFQKSFFFITAYFDPWIYIINKLIFFVKIFIIFFIYHPNFIKTNPNKVYSLIRTFGRNLISFHSGNGETYQFMANIIIELDKLNPNMATTPYAIDICLELMNNYLASGIEHHNVKAETDQWNPIERSRASLVLVV